MTQSSINNSRQCNYGCGTQINWNTWKWIIEYWKTNNQKAIVQILWFVKQEKKESNEKEIELNEHLYKSHFGNIDTLEEIINESQQTHDQTNDPVIKEISTRTIKTAKKYLTELEEKKVEITKKDANIQRKLE